MNNLFYINAYRQGKTWLFDDRQRELIAEPFVSGASELIQKYLDRKGIIATQDVPLVFSTQPFPQAEVTLTCIEKCPSYVTTGEFEVSVLGINIPKYKHDFDNPNSAWYIDQEGDKCWLCPAQIKFFGQVADVIYAKIG